MTCVSRFSHQLEAVSYPGLTGKVNVVSCIIKLRIFIGISTSKHSFLEGQSNRADSHVSRSTRRGGGVLPIVGYTGRFRPKGVPFLSSRYIKG